VGIAALRSGKHVLCEKPLARSVEECRQMVDAAAQSGRLLATGFNYRFYPPVRKAEQYLHSGLIGELDHIRSYAGYSATELSHSWMREAETMGGGALRDNGIHLIDLTCYFLGEVEDVKGYTTNTVWGLDGCEDNGFALLCNTEGKVASLQASWTEWRGYRFLLDIYGTLGCIRISCFPMYTQVSWSKQRGGKKRSKFHFFPMTHIRERLQTYRRVVIDSFVEELNAFARAVEGERTPLATGLDGLRAIDVAQRACNIAPESTCAASSGR
jgi:predicted dehydrogenase